MTEILLRIGNLFFQFVNIMVVANVMLRFINPQGKGPFAGFVLSMTEPLLQPLRRFLRFKTIDLSPFAVVMIVEYALMPLYAYLIVRIFG